ncbi:MAG TPA: DUF3014 domain-containing protein [Polyangia bacterium]|jgi:hypothetical protein|nr:DUF3014 domain-containing protein [Polyangia bacterium]
MNQGSRIVVIVIVALAAGGGVLWWRRHQMKPVAVAPAQVVAPTPPAVEPTPPPPPPPPAIAHPIAHGELAGKLPALDQADTYVKDRLVELVGRKGALAFLGIDDFVRHFVATVANLGTDHAPADLWPVKRTEGTFEADARGDASVIGAKNFDRYALFVAFVDGIDTGKAVALYRRLYPLFQQAYEELGYPGKYFNDRAVEVIDDLLATPDVAEPIKVKLVSVPGAEAAVPGQGKPRGGLYVFDDPSLESRTAGQKILLRLGRAHAARLKAKLTAVRALIASGPNAPRTK